MVRALDRALQLVEHGERDPVSVMKHVAQLGQLLRQAKQDAPAAAAVGSVEALAARLERLERQGVQSPGAGHVLTELGADHLVRLPVARAVAPGLDLGPLKVEWPGGAGRCLALLAGTLEGTESSLSMVSVRIAINGTQDVISDGANPDFAPLVALHARDHQWFRLTKEVSSQEKWMVTFRHEGPAASPAVTPFLLFSYQRT